MVEYHAEGGSNEFLNFACRQQNACKMFSFFNGKVILQKIYAAFSPNTFLCFVKINVCPSGNK